MSVFFIRAPVSFFNRFSAKVRRLTGEARWGLMLCGRRVFAIEAFRRLWLVENIASRILHRLIPPDQAIPALDSIPADEVARHKVSVVIPVFNGIAQGLERLLESLQAQTHRNLEVVAVDSGSTDGSDTLVERYGARLIRIPKSEFRHDYARNLGAENATGDFVLFTVCDCRFHDPRWVELGLRHLLRYNATSFSTPQSVDDRAEPYARYLAWNFVQANGYGEGVNLLGHRRWGQWGYRLGGARARLRSVHVDDTNHLVRRDFFLRNPYFLPTCEDMGFGVKLICSNGQWVYSTLTSVRHYHEYADVQKYFARVFVDLCVVERFLRPASEMPPSDGVVDAIVAAGGTVLDVLLRTLRDLRESGVEKISFCGPPRTSAEIGFGSLCIILREAMSNPGFLLFEGLGQEAEGSQILTRQIGLLVEPDRRFAALQAFRHRAFGHVLRTCEVLERYLGYSGVSLDDFRHFVVLTFLNILARDLSLSITFGRDDRSRNVALLQSVVWR